MLSESDTPDPGHSLKHHKPNCCTSLVFTYPQELPLSCRTKQLRFATSCPAFLCLSLINLICILWRKGRWEGPRHECCYRVFEVASLFQEERKEKMARPGHSWAKKVAHLLAPLYLMWALLASPTACSHSGLRYFILPCVSKRSPLPLNSNSASCNHLLDSWSLGEINSPGLKQVSPKTALFLSPVHLWGQDALTTARAVLWLRMLSQPVHHADHLGPARQSVEGGHTACSS